MSDREQIITAFLQQNGFGDAERIFMGGDASTRRYERLVKDGKTFMLMDAPMSADAQDGNMWHPGMTEAERRAMGVDAMRWRAGSRVDAFVCINGWLEENGFSVPHVHCFDVSQGLAILEYLDDGQYWQMLEQGNGSAPELAMYEAATDALIRLDQLHPPAVLQYETASWKLLPFDKLVIEEESAIFPEWYVTQYKGISLPPEAIAEYKKAWSRIADLLTTSADRLITRDYHSPNLMWLPEREGYRRAGILDHQDAVLSHPSFNLMFLLNDPRRDVPEYIQSAMLDRYFAGTGFERAEFMKYYAAHQALQAFRIVGLFCRLSIRDKKTHFMVHVPRMEKYIQKALLNPACVDLKQWLATYLPSFNQQAA